MGTVMVSSLSSIIGTLMALAIEIGLIIIAQTIVKPKRADAATLFLLGAVVNVMATLLWPFFTTIVTGAVYAGASAGDMRTIYAAVGLLGALIRTLGWGLVLYGIVKLANPPGAGAGDPTRYT